MKVSRIVGALALAAGALMLVIGSFQATGFAGEPAKVTVKSKKGDVTFDHAAHGKTVGCEKCHHNFKGGDKSKPKCGDCHKAAAEGTTPSAKDAFHNSCTKCHKAEKAKKADTKAPTMCNDCHKK
jgi:hypothetical protein